MEKADIILFFLNLQSQIHILHWQTKSFAKHKAFDEIYEGLDSLVDDFIEIYQGKYGRIYLEGKAPLPLYDIDEESINSQIAGWIDTLEEGIPSLLSERDTDLLNLRDEVLALISKLKYLLTLK
jgi:DNA-binding ferritin-like protein